MNKRYSYLMIRQILYSCEKIWFLLWIYLIELKFIWKDYCFSRCYY